MNTLKLYIKIMSLTLKINKLEKMVDKASYIIAHDLPDLIEDCKEINITKDDVKKWLSNSLK